MTRMTHTVPVDKMVEMVIRARARVWEVVGRLVRSLVPDEICAGRLKVRGQLSGIRSQAPHRSPTRGIGAGSMVRSPVPDEVCAGRLAEAEAESFKGVELAYAPGGVLQAVFRTCRPENRWSCRSAGAQTNRDGTGIAQNKPRHPGGWNARVGETAEE